MPANLQNLPDLNAVFDLQQFRFMDLKKVITIILENLGDLHNKFDSLTTKFNSLEIPDTGKIMLLIQELDKKQFQSEKSQRQLYLDLEEFKVKTNKSIDELKTDVSDLNDKDNCLEARIQALEHEVEELWKRPTGGSSIDGS